MGTWLNLTHAGEWTWLSGLSLMTIKLTLILAAAWLVHSVCRTLNPRWRVGGWRIAMVACAVLIALVPLPPLKQWKFEVVDPLTAPVATVAVADSVGQQSAEQSPVSQPPVASSIPAHAVNDPIEVAAAPDMFAPVEAMPTPSPAFDLYQFVFWIWGAGVMLALVKQLAGMFHISRLLATAVPADEALLQKGQSLANRLGVRCPPIWVCEGIASPSVVGFWKPKLLMPSTVLDRNDTSDINAALAHELAHVVGNDLRWDFMIRLLSSLAWLHPLVWRAPEAHRRACDRVSDLVAADLINDRTSYRSSLARIALQVGGGTNVHCGLEMARRADVVDRLRALASNVSAVALGRRGWLASTVFLTAAVLLGGSAVVLTSSAIAETSVAQEELVVTVLAAEDDQPLDEATIKFWYYDGERTRETNMTDDTGSVTYVYPDREKPATLSILVKRPGYVPYRAELGKQPRDARAHTKMIRMEKGEQVGGIVVDQDGEPLSGATVDITVPSIDPPRDSHVYSLIDTKTSDDGRWLLDSGPPPVTGLRVKIDHPKFKRRNFDVQPGVDTTYPLEPGWSITGVIRDDQGNPVVGANVGTGDSRFSSNRYQATTDDKGCYRLEGLDRDSTRLTVTTKDFAPVMAVVEPEGKSETDGERDFSLEPGRTIRFRFIDVEGNPIEGVGIAADTWRGFRSIKWRSKSDAQGEAVWTGAPEDVVIYDSFCTNYRDSRDMSLLPTNDEHVITLKPAFRFTGTVTAADTGQPIEEFEAMMGWPSRGSIRWDYDQKICRRGKLAIESDSGSKSTFLLRVRAKGYQPWVSEEFDSAQIPPPLKISLQPGAGPGGVVLTPDGELASDAIVALALPGQGNSFQFQKGYRPYGAPQKVETDTDGRFQLASLDDENTDGLIAIVHDSGYLEVPLSRLADEAPLKLEGWAKITFRVALGDKPAVDRPVYFSPSDDQTRVFNIFSYGIETTTDANGVAVFDKVVPRTGYAGLRVKQSFGSSSNSYPHRSRKLELNPGDNVTVEIGGEGREVKGQIALPAKAPEPHSWKYNEAGQIETSGYSYDDPQYRSYRFLVDADGRFEVPDIPAGNYKFELDLTAEPSAQQCGSGQRIGRASIASFSIDAEGSTAHDLGTIQGEWFKRLGVGDMAPNFVAAKADGSMTMSDLAGQLVLIDFWATWCAPCMAEMPELAKIQKKFGADDRFTLLGVSLDESLEDALKLTRERGWDWPLVHGGSGYGGMIPRGFDVKAIPVKFLVGPDGKILYRGTDLKEVTALIEQELKNVPR